LYGILSLRANPKYDFKDAGLNGNFGINSETAQIKQSLNSVKHPPALSIRPVIQLHQTRQNSLVLLLLDIHIL
jgi:hypothetical protein